MGLALLYTRYCINRNMVSKNKKKWFWGWSAPKGQPLPHRLKHKY